MSRGPICTLQYLLCRYSSIPCVPLFSCLTCGPMAEDPWFKANTQPMRCQLYSSCGGRGWGCKGGGPLCVATEKNAKISEVHSITSYFGHEDLVKTKLFYTFSKRKRAKLSIKIKNFKISQVKEEPVLSKVWLKPEN